MSNLPLAGLRVIDLSRVRAGPTCVKFFGDFGADVIKVERTDGEGDPMADNRYSSDYLSTVGNESYLRLCAAIGAPQLGTDPRFLTAELREQHRAEVNAAIEAATLLRSAAEWVDILNAAGVPAGPIYRLDEMFADPQVQETGIVQPIEHPKLGRIDIIGQPIAMSRTPPQFRRAPPELGEHTNEVLAEAGFSSEEINDLRSAGIV